jgi:hypothetical protein
MGSLRWVRNNPTDPINILANIIHGIGPVECLKHDELTDTWVTRLKWGFGTCKEDVKVAGCHVVTIVKGTVHFCYGFLEGGEEKSLFTELHE